MAAPSAHVVIARYNEPFKWAAEFATAVAPAVRMYVYDKGEPLTVAQRASFPPGTVFVVLPNVGRESHTYLHHIVTHYASLPPLLVCLQGRVDDHGVNAEPVALRAKFLNLPREALVGGTWRTAHIHAGATSTGHFAAWAGPLSQQPQSVWEWFAATMERPEVDPRSVTFPTCFTANFSVRRRCVWARPRAFYAEREAALASSGVNDELGHFHERTWYVVLSVDKPLTLAQEAAAAAAAAAVAVAPPHPK